MFKISAEGFRGFQKQAALPVRPITLLIGENSAGKTSFLAAIKFVVDLVSGNEEPSFNKDPFQLGTFDQIAHYRLGKSGRAKDFSISISANVSRRDSGSLAKRDYRDIVYQVNFKDIDSQSQIWRVKISDPTSSLQLDIARTGLSLSFNNGSETRSLEKFRGLPRSVQANFSRYWMFILRDLRFRLANPTSRDQVEMFNNDEDKKILDLAEFGDAISRYIGTGAIATSAIRTKPIRTYTPGKETEDGEGSHVPYELAKLFRLDRKNWSKIQESMIKFGVRSDMFSGVHVKAFGKSPSDPFQIQLSFGGPRMNIADLGYGTSQVLPILYSMATAPKNAMILVQQPEVHLHPRAQAALAEHFISDFVENGRKLVLETHSDFLVDRFRLAIRRGVLKPDDVSVIFFQRSKLGTEATHIEYDLSGDPIDAPEGFREFFLEEELRLLGFDDVNHH